MNTNIDTMEDKPNDTIKFLDTFFDGFNSKLKEIESIKLDLFDNTLVDKLENELHLTETLIKKSLDEDRTSKLNLVKSKADLSLSLNLRYLPINFKESRVRIDDSSLLIGYLTYKNKFKILKKFNYFSYLNQFTNEIQLAEDLILFMNVRILVLSPKRLFVYLRTKENQTSFKIFNDKCQEICSVQIDKDLIYKNVISWNLSLVSLFYNPKDNRKHILSFYDKDLRLLAVKSIELDLNLCSLNENEIVCWNSTDKVCQIYDFNLNLISSIGQHVSEHIPYYFSNGILIEASQTLILFYYFHEDEEKHFIKIMDRKTGHLTGIINFDFNYFSKMIRIDSESNILVRLYEPNNEIKYFDSKGKLLKIFSNNELTKIGRIDLSQNDDIVCYDKTENKILFF